MSSAYEIGGSLSVVHGTHSRGEHEPDWRSAASSVTGTRYEPPHSRAHAALRSSLAWQFNRPRLYGLDELRTAALKIGRRPADVVTHMNDTIWAAAKIWAVILERDPEYRALMCAYLNCADPYFVIENHHVIDVLVHKDHIGDLALLAWYATAGGDLNRLSLSSGHGLIHAASVDEHPETIRWLSAQGCALNVTTGKVGSARGAVQSTAMHLAAMSGKLKSLDALHAAGALIESRNSLGQTPLLVAIGRVSVLEWFAAHGANLHTTSSCGSGVYDRILELKAQFPCAQGTETAQQLKWCMIHGVGSNGCSEEIPPGSFSYGSFVEFHGLRSAAGLGLNGTQGTVIKYDFSAQRYLVTCEIGPDGRTILEGKSNRVKATNLRCVEEPPIASADSTIDETPEPKIPARSFPLLPEGMRLVGCSEEVAYGDPVMLHSLISRSDLNGTWARVAAQPVDSTVARARVKVVRCEGLSELGGPAWGWSKLLETGSVATTFVTVRPENLAMLTTDVTSDSVSEGNFATIAGLSTELIIKIFGFLSRAQRVTLAACNRSFRTVLFDTGSAALWSGVLKLELSNCTEQGAGWFVGETCTLCGTSFLDTRIYLCNDCQRAGFCEACACYPSRTHQEVCCDGVRPQRAGVLTFICSAASDIGDPNNGLTCYPKLVPLPQKSLRAGTGSLHCITDRWLCALPGNFRRAITKVVTRLVIGGSDKNIGSPLVGMGALLQPYTPGPAWPQLSAVTTSEPGGSDDWQTKIGNILIQHTWCQQLVRLSKSMPMVTSLALSEAGNGLPGLERHHEVYGLFEDHAILAAFKSVTHFEGFRLDPIYDWDHKTIRANPRWDKRESAHLACDHYWSIEELQKQMPMISRTLPSLCKLRLTCSGCCLWRAAEAIAQRCTTVTHLFLDGDSAITQIMGSQACDGVSDSSDWSDDFRVHLDSLQGHPSLKELHISWDNCSIKGYRGLEWTAFPGVVHCFSPETQPELESKTLRRSPDQKDWTTRKKSTKAELAKTEQAQSDVAVWRETAGGGQHMTAQLDYTNTASQAEAMMDRPGWTAAWSHEYNTWYWWNDRHETTWDDPAEGEPTLVPSEPVPQADEPTLVPSEPVPQADLLFDEHSEFCPETLAEPGSVALLEARLLLLSHLVYDAQRAAGPIQLYVYPLAFGSLPAYLHEEYRRIAGELCAKTADLEVERAIRSVFACLSVKVISAKSDERSFLQLSEVVNRPDEPYESAWREQFSGKHTDLSPQPFTLNWSLESLSQRLKNINMHCPGMPYGQPSLIKTSCLRTFGSVNSDRHWAVFAPTGIISQFQETRQFLARIPGGLDILMNHVRWGLQHGNALSRPQRKKEKQMYNALLVAEAEHLALPLTESAMLASPAKPVITREVLTELIDALATCKNFGMMTVEHIGVKLGISLGQDMDDHMSTIGELLYEAFRCLLLAEPHAASILIKTRVQAVALELSLIDDGFNHWTSATASMFTFEAMWETAGADFGGWPTEPDFNSRLRREFRQALRDNDLLRELICKVEPPERDGENFGSNRVNHPAGLVQSWMTEQALEGSNRPKQAHSERLIVPHAEKLVEKLKRDLTGPSSDALKRLLGRQSSAIPSSRVTIN